MTEHAEANDGGSSDGQSSDGSDDELNGVTVVFTPDDILKIGLKLVHYTNKRIKRSRKSRNIERFKSHFGAVPVVVANIFDDLQLTGKLPEDKRNVNHLLMAMHTLKCYPLNDEREALFDINRNDAAKISWYFIERIRALKEEKIVWPTKNGSDKEDDDEIWVITVDGIHFWVKEPEHATWSLDEAYYSHKYNKAGLDYELGISLTGGLVWMNGPFPAGRSDRTIFAQDGLKAKLLASQKKAIGDRGYTGHQEAVSTPNNHDDRSVKKFKSRALKRHEKFNGRIKSFGALAGRFRHSKDYFTYAAEAACVICQYEVEVGEPLFDILIEDILPKDPKDP